MKVKKFIFNAVRILKSVFLATLTAAFITISVSASFEAETLLELNLENFDGTTGIQNIGSSDSVCIDMSPTANVKLNRVDVINIHRDKVSYIRKTHSMYNWVAISSQMNIYDTSWEENDVTFSWWADLNTVTDADQGKCVAEYRITYEVDGTEGKVTLPLCQINNENQTNYIWNIGYNTETPIDMASSKGWTHVVMTSPKRDSNGNKKIDVYINGVYKKSKALTIPKDAVITSAKLTFGGTADNTMVPTDASYGNIRVYESIISSEHIAEMYESEKDIYTPLEGGINLVITNSDGKVTESFINYSDVINGINAGLTIDNTDEKELEGTFFAAVYDEESMKEAVSLGEVSVSGREVGYENIYSVSDAFSDIKLGDKISFFLWSKELTPYIKTKTFYIKNMLISESGSLRIVINMDRAPAANSIVPDAFEITSSGISYKPHKSIYYPLSKELHLIIDNAYEISVPCRVKAALTDIDGNEFDMDINAAVSSEESIPMYGDGIKYALLYKGNEAVANAYDSGSYTVKICAVLQGESRHNSVDIVLLRKRGSEETEIDRKKVSFTEEDYIYTTTCSLEPGDSVYAKIQ